MEDPQTSSQLDRESDDERRGLLSIGRSEAFYSAVSTRQNTEEEVLLESTGSDNGHPSEESQLLEIPDTVSSAFVENNFKHPFACLAWLSVVSQRSPNTFYVVQLGLPESGKEKVLKHFSNEVILTSEMENVVLQHTTKIPSKIFQVTNLKIVVLDTPGYVPSQASQSMQTIEEFFKCQRCVPNFIVICARYSDSTLTQKHSNFRKMLKDSCENLANTIDRKSPNVILVLTHIKESEIRSEDFPQKVNKIFSFVQETLGMLLMSVALEPDVWDGNKNFITLPNSRKCYASVLLCMQRKSKALAEAIVSEVLIKRKQTYMQTIVTRLSDKENYPTHTTYKVAGLEDIAHELPASASTTTSPSRATQTTYEVAGLEKMVCELPESASTRTSPSFLRSRLQLTTIANKLNSYVYEQGNTGELKRYATKLASILRNYNYTYMEQLPTSAELGKRMVLMKYLLESTNDAQRDLLSESLNLSVPVLRSLDLLLGCRYNFLDNKVKHSIIEKKQIALSPIGCYLPTDFNATITGDIRYKWSHFSKEDYADLALQASGLSASLLPIAEGFAKVGFQGECYIKNSKSSDDVACLYQLSCYKLDLDEQTCSLAQHIEKKLQRIMEMPKPSSKEWDIFFNDYGTHYVTEVELGGSLIMTFSRTKAATLFGGRILEQLDVKLVSAVIGASSESKTSDDSLSVQYSVVGGNNIELGASPVRNLEAFNEWRSSIADNFRPLPSTMRYEKITKLVKEEWRITVEDAMDEYLMRRCPSRFWSLCCPCC